MMDEGRARRSSSTEFGQRALLGDHNFSPRLFHIRTSWSILNKSLKSEEKSVKVLLGRDIWARRNE